jgi:hypothetical protein
MGSGSPVTLYYNSNIGNANNLTVGDYLYTNTALTTVVASLGCALQYGSSATTTICSDPAGYAGCIDTDSNGAITALNTSAC